MAELRPVHGECAAKVGSTLIVADLHIGIERSLAKKGFKVLSGTRAIVQRILRMKAKRLVLLGDLKDQVAGTSPGLEGELMAVAEELASAFGEVVLVRGNHDAGLPRPILRHIAVVPASGLAVSGVSLIHGHTRPSVESLSHGKLVVAHTHPRVELVDDIGRSSFEPCWARFPARKGGDPASKLREVIAMPAFNPLCGGAPVNRLEERLLGPALSESVIDRAKGSLHLLDGTCLGTVGSLSVRGRMDSLKGSYWERPRTAGRPAKARRQRRG